MRRFEITKVLTSAMDHYTRDVVLWKFFDRRQLQQTKQNYPHSLATSTHQWLSIAGLVPEIALAVMEKIVHPYKSKNNGKNSFRYKYVGDQLLFGQSNCFSY